MLIVKNLLLYHFKNYNNRLFEFNKRITGFCGPNGAGKTNLLDAIHYLCFTKSYFARTDSFNVLHGGNGFRIHAETILQEQPETATCIFRIPNKKEFLINDLAYDKFSQHIGRYPCVIIAPDDAILITGPSENRRKFIDAVLSQFNSAYLQQLIAYNKILLQRNALLKTMNETGNHNSTLLEVYDQQLIEAGNFVFNIRKDFLLGFLPRVKRLYQDIAEKQEEVQLLYESDLLHGNFADLLTAARQKDIYAQRTTTGIHKDDIEITYNQQPFKQMASQGQRKSLLFALKLQEMHTLSTEKGFPPLLLLDDVFEKLDENRIKNLLHMVCVQNSGQVFITDTQSDRLAAHLEAIVGDGEFEIINIS